MLIVVVWIFDFVIIFLFGNFIKVIVRVIFYCIIWYVWILFWWWCGFGVGRNYRKFNCYS